MTHPSLTPSPAPPRWPHCGHGSSPEDPIGCCGIRIAGHTACFAHLTDTDRDTYLAGLTFGADIDHRGTPFTESRWLADRRDQLPAEVRRSTTRQCRSRPRNATNRPPALESGVP